MGRACSTCGERRGAYSILAGKPEGKRPLERPSPRRKKTLKWTFKKRDGGMGWIDLAQYKDRLRALLNVVMNFRVP